MPSLSLRCASLALIVSLAAGCSLLPSRVADEPAASPAPPSSPVDRVSNIAIPAHPVAPQASEPDAAAEEELAPSVWVQYRLHSQLNLEIDNPRIRAQRDWYIRHSDYLNRVIARAEPYLYHVQKEAIRRGLPSELILLPIVESAYDPFAYSHGRAAGLWQFIPGTGEAFGLQQTWWYEGRRDVLASTDAAFNYLAQLARQFDGDWLLALAAYNGGQGTIQRAIDANRRRGRPTDFWSLNLRAETSAYVPKLLALAQIFRQPERYNLVLREVAHEPFFTAVNVKSQIDLAQAANMAGISIEELYRLNPAFNRWATDPQGPHRLLVPVVQAQQFQLELDNLPPEKRVRWDHYTIRSGDTVSAVARKFKITPELLRTVNNMPNNNLRAGKTLLIPQASQPLDAYALSAEQRLQKKLASPVAGKQKTLHRVASGESLWQIARRHKVDMAALARWNNMAPRDSLSAGRELVVWSSAGSTGKSLNPANRTRKISYRARSGDSYAGIADRFNISLHELKRWNNVNLKKYLQPGDMLTLYVDITNAP